MVAGGVSANQQLRAKLAQMVQDLGAEVYYPRPAFCTDNGAMIAFAGYLRLQRGETVDLPIVVKPRWPMVEL